MPPIKMRTIAERYEELTAICVRTCICHTKQTCFQVFPAERLVAERTPIDGLTTGAVSCREVTALCHEARYYTVKYTALEV